MLGGDVMADTRNGEWADNHWTNKCYTKECRVNPQDTLLKIVRQTSGMLPALQHKEAAQDKEPFTAASPRVICPWVNLKIGS